VLQLRETVVRAAGVCLLAGVALFFLGRLVGSMFIAAAGVPLMVIGAAGLALAGLAHLIAVNQRQTGRP
jgi:hypothetical protein